MDMYLHSNGDWNKVLGTAFIYSGIRQGLYLAIININVCSCFPLSHGIESIKNACSHVTGRFRRISVHVLKIAVVPQCFR